MKLKRGAVAVGFLLAASCGSPTSNDTNAGPRAALHALFEREWEWELSQDPVGASYLGDRRWNDRWPDISSDALAARHAHRESVLKELAAIAREQLPATDRTSYDIFKYQSEMAVEGFQHRYHLIRTTTTDGVQNSEQIVDALRFQTIKDYDDWLARLDAFPTYVEQNIALMRQGLKTNVAPSQDHHRACARSSGRARGAACG